MDDQLLVTLLPDAVLVVEGERVVRCNPAATRMLGADPTGRTVQDLLEPGQAQRLRLLETQMAAGWPLPTWVRARFVRADGSVVTAEVRSVAAPGSDAHVLCARDLTQATRAEALMGNLALLSFDRPLLDGPDALLDATAPVFLALGWTAAFTDVFADHSVTRRVISPEGNPVGDYGRSIVGRALPFERTAVLAEVVRSRDALFLDNVPALTEEGRARALSESMLKARFARSAWCPVVRNGSVTHILSVTGSDLTEHDFVALRLFAAELGAAVQLHDMRLELVRRERLAALGEMAAVLAHEVRNPLGAMFAAVATLRQSGAASSEEQRSHLLDILMEEAERLQRLATDLLSFARPNAVSLAPVEIAPVVDVAVDLARHDPSYVARAPRIVVRTAPGKVSADAALLTRALVNLLVNACQHVTPGGTISVDGSPRDGRYVLRVENDGPPLAPELHDKVFEPFFTTKPAGTGLGLAIVRRIASDMGGQVEVETNERGVAFVMSLRAA